MNDPVNQRIIEVMTQGKYSKTEFAALLGISQPLLSHLSSGRNKASLEIVQKVHEVFPDISLEWLLTGTGAMRIVRKETRDDQSVLLFEGLLYRINQVENEVQELKKAAQTLGKELNKNKDGT